MFPLVLVVLKKEEKKETKEKKKEKKENKEKKEKIIIGYTAGPIIEVCNVLVNSKYTELVKELDPDKVVLDPGVHSPDFPFLVEVCKTFWLHHIIKSPSMLDRTVSQAETVIVYVCPTRPTFVETYVFVKVKFPTCSFLCSQLYAEINLE